MPNSLWVFTGLPATGKTTQLIETMLATKKQGKEVKLFLSNEHHELTRRPNVKPGGVMGCRTPGMSFPIDYVCSTEDVGEILKHLNSSTVAVFDEAQFFSHKIVPHWANAVKKGIDVYVSSPSVAQLLRLKLVKHRLKKFTVDCSACEVEMAKHVVYKSDLKFPTHLCSKCKNNYMQNELSELLESVKQSEPFPGKYHTYQPFYDVDMSDFELVRGDSQARLNIILESINRCDSISKLLNDSGDQPTFLDLGCCSGFFSDAMNVHGFRSTGIDVGQHFIDWAEKLAKLKGQAITYQKIDAHEYLSTLTTDFDVVSTFATIQWVMAQNDYSKGLECFKMLFDKTKHVAIVEMGYNTEEIYRDRIPGAPVIDGEWVKTMMEDLGNFETIEFHPSGENGIWRDVFVGYKKQPISETNGPTIVSKPKKSFKQKVRISLKRLAGK